MDDDLGGCDNLVFISDRQKGLVESFKDLLPTTEHRFCMRHIMIHPVPSEDAWVVSDLDALAPPFFRKPTGRPKKVRRRGDDEARNPSTVGRSNKYVTCARCLERGHNKRSCKVPVHPQSRLVRQSHEEALNWITHSDLRSNSDENPADPTKTKSCTCSGCYTNSETVSMDTYRDWGSITIRPEIAQNQCWKATTLRAFLAATYPPKECPSKQPFGGASL
ncbi:hypothetical protein RJ639_022432 [Escallonia herrerae]|uniref:Uncharacterized protein n=1 Tax=Escallonia herrerae TaxID=1293975 RepID=A0AA88V5C6_9ASTE|nr:hypothetical protein RJ639_022432 [Escallonia herrerae]